MLRYFIDAKFYESLRNLHRSGGNFQKASIKARAIIGAIPSGDDPFIGVNTTKHGETRIEHCVKYDLDGYCRLVTVQDNGCCVFVFVGKHEECDRWIESHKGLRLVVDGKNELMKAFVSMDTTRRDSRIASESDYSDGSLYKKLGTRHYDRIAAGVPRSILVRFEELESISTEDEILTLACEMENSERNILFFDVFSLLRKGDIRGAKQRVDVFTNDLLLVEQISQKRVSEISTGEDFVELQDFEPEIIDHFMKSATFHQWMLFMHPAQKAIVEKDFNGPARLSGVSGSGKTCVVVKRALYLTKKYPGQRILVLTLNKALAKLIDDLITLAGGGPQMHISVRSFWQLCQDELRTFEPKNLKLYDELTWKTNEHVSEVWDEFYHCLENNEDAAVLRPVHQSLLVRNVFPKDYIKQEFDFIRSALSSESRSEYKSMERDGRSEPFLQHFREMILDGLAAWEEKMRFVGVVDYLGLAAALHKYLPRITPKYRSILVDEVQDFGTVELEIIRKLTPEAENDIFLCGDVAQRVYTKHHIPSSAGIGIVGRSSTIRRNYRNSHEILAAAYGVLCANLSEDLRKKKEFEILEPEYANFSTPKPLLLKAANVPEEFDRAFAYYSDVHSSDLKQKSCIALCGYSLKDVLSIGSALRLPVLDGTTNINDGSLFLSDLEQSKGFEFDSMCILNCNAATIPDPSLPTDEWYREVFKLYVAMTRAKRELIISWSEQLSSFITKCSERFTGANWSEHSKLDVPHHYSLPASTARSIEQSYQGENCLDLTGREFIYTKRAIGATLELQNKLTEYITGIDKALDKKQIEWKSIRHALDPQHRDRVYSQFGQEAYRQFIAIFGS